MVETLRSRAGGGRQNGSVSEFEGNPLFLGLEPWFSGGGVGSP